MPTPPRPPSLSGRYRRATVPHGHIGGRVATTPTTRRKWLDASSTYCWLGTAMSWFIVAIAVVIVGVRIAGDAAEIERLSKRLAGTQRTAVWLAGRWAESQQRVYALEAARVRAASRRVVRVRMLRVDTITQASPPACTTPNQPHDRGCHHR